MGKTVQVGWATATTVPHNVCSIHFPPASCVTFVTRGRLAPEPPGPAVRP